MKGLAANLVMKGKIETTETRAKEVAREVVKHITLAKKGNLASYRKLIERLPKNAATKLFKDIAPRFKERHGGYTRMYRTSRRHRDGAPMAIIELIK